MMQYFMLHISKLKNVKGLFSGNHCHWLNLCPMKEINMLHTLNPSEKLNVSFKGTFSRKLETLLKIGGPCQRNCTILSDFVVICMPAPLCIKGEVYCVPPQNPTVCFTIFVAVLAPIAAALCGMNIQSCTYRPYSVMVRSDGEASLKPPTRGVLGCCSGRLQFGSGHWNLDRLRADHLAGGTGRAVPCAAVRLWAV
jgi:hypothetical protein